MKISRLDNYKNTAEHKNAGKDSVGIGLALAKTIIESQHGEISVESEEGIGSTFEIKLYKTII